MATAFLVFVALGVVTAREDERWARGLAAWSDSGLARFLSQSLFEGHAFGGSDVGVLVAIAAAFLYLGSHFHGPLRRWRAEIGYVAMNSVLLGTVLVQSLKWALARPRPYAVFSGEVPFRPWWNPAGFVISAGRYAGSFPSGHTATVLTLASFVFVLWGRGHRRASAGMAAFVIGGALAMGAARTMVGKHWPSDSLLLVPLAFVFSGVVYETLFAVPARLGKGLKEPPLWELWVTLQLAGAAASAAVATILFRACGGLDFWALGALLATLCMVLFLGWLYRFHGRVRACLSGGGVRENS